MFHSLINYILWLENARHIDILSNIIILKPINLIENVKCVILIKYQNEFILEYTANNPDKFLINDPDNFNSLYLPLLSTQ